MSIGNYRTGYEEMKQEIAESEDQGLAERFVKGLVSLPLTAFEDLTRDDDEAQGRDDALNGREFDPSR